MNAVRIIIRAVIALSVIASVSGLVKVLILDSFIVYGESMEPTYHEGQKVFVNKLLFGPRIYKNYDFTNPRLSSFRLPGMRKVRLGDVIIFNYPEGRSNNRIEFKINHVCLKRCLGLPGDTVSIAGGYYRNSSCPGIAIGVPSSQYRLAAANDSSLQKKGCIQKVFTSDAYPDWTIRDYGPLVIPKKGLTIDLTTPSAIVYSNLIEYECGIRVCELNGCLYLKGCPLDSYTFNKNYYFMAGDNVLNSHDSRYFGLIPEEYIVGIVSSVGRGSAKRHR